MAITHQFYGREVKLRVRVDGGFRAGVYQDQVESAFGAISGVDAVSCVQSERTEGMPVNGNDMMIFELKLTSDCDLEVVQRDIDQAVYALDHVLSENFS